MYRCSYMFLCVQILTCMCTVCVCTCVHVYAHTYTCVFLFLLRSQEAQLRIVEEMLFNELKFDKHFQNCSASCFITFNLCVLVCSVVIMALTSFSSVMIKIMYMCHLIGEESMHAKDMSLSSRSQDGRREPTLKLSSYLYTCVVANLEPTTYIYGHIILLLTIIVTIIIKKYVHKAPGLISDMVKIFNILPCCFYYPLDVMES